MSLRAFAVVAALAALPATAALADVREACHRDRETLCGGVEKGGGRIARCMAEHRAQLSPACKLALADRMLERRAERGDRPQVPGQRPTQNPLR